MKKPKAKKPKSRTMVVRMDEWFVEEQTSTGFTLAAWRGSNRQQRHALHFEFTSPYEAEMVVDACARWLKARRDAYVECITNAKQDFEG